MDTLVYPYFRKRGIRFTPLKKIAYSTPPSPSRRLTLFRPQAFVLKAWMISLTDPIMDMWQHYFV